MGMKGLMKAFSDGLTIREEWIVIGLLRGCILSKCAVGWLQKKWIIGMNCGSL